MHRLYQTNSAIIPDATDAAILDKREAEFNARTGPRVGDFVQIGDRFGRFSHDWGDGLQWSEGGSWYLSGSHASFSGGLNASIPLDNLQPTDDTREGDFWFFHHGHSGAHRGVGVRIPCRVFKAKTSLFTFSGDGQSYTVEACDRSDAVTQGLRLIRAWRKENGLNDYEYYPKDWKVQHKDAF